MSAKVIKTVPRGGKLSFMKKFRRSGKKLKALYSSGLVLIAMSSGLVFWQIQNASADYITQGNLVGYWPLDESSGSASVDVSGYGGDGTHNGSPAPSYDLPTTSFPNSRSLDFDGTNSVSTLDAGVADMTTNDFSVSLWFKSTTNNYDNQYLVSKRDGGTGYEVGLNPAGGIYVYLGDGSSQISNTIGSGGTIFNGDSAWHHLTVVFDQATAVEAYVDGTSLGTLDTTSVTNSVSNAGNLTFAQESDSELPAQNLIGLMDDVRIYTRVLSEGEIDQLADGDNTTATWTGATSTVFNLAGNWDINAVPDAYTNIDVPATDNNVILGADTGIADLNIQSGATLSLNGNNLIVNSGGGFTNNGILKLTGGETLTNFTNDSGNTGMVWYSGSGSYANLAAGNSYRGLKFSGGGTWGPGSGSVTVTSDLSIGTGSTFNAGSATIYLGGNFQNSGTFNAGTSTVNFNGYQQSMTGSNTFYNLTNTGATGNSTLTFPAGLTQTITNHLYLYNIDLRSSNPGTQWKIDVQNTFSLNWLDIRDSNNVSGGSPLMTYNSSGSNYTNWDIEYPSVSSFGPTNLTYANWLDTTTPTFNFTTSDADSTQVRYRIVVTNLTSGGTLIDYTSAFENTGAKSFTVGQVAGTGSYATGSSGQELTSGRYVWTIHVTDDGALGGLSRSYNAPQTYVYTPNEWVNFILDVTAPSAPAFSLSDSLPFGSDQTTELTSTDNVEGSGMDGIYYTTNGTTPSDVNGTKINSEDSIDITSNVVVKAIAYDVAGNASAVVTKNYVVDKSNPNIPTVDIGTGMYNADQTVEVSATDNDGGTGIDAIYYTTNNLEPSSAQGTKIDGSSGTFEITDTTIVKMIAYDEVGNPSPILTQTYTIDKIAPNTPTANVASGSYTTAQAITLSSVDDTYGTGLEGIYYTLDGSEPTNSSTEYTAPVDIATPKTLKAIAYDNAGNTSGVLSRTYVVDLSDPSAVLRTTPDAGSWINNNQPTVNFTTSNTDDSQVKYQVQIDVNSNFSSPTIDYTSALADTGDGSFTVGEAAGAGSYDVGSSGQELDDDAYFWRVRTISTTDLNSSWAEGGSSKMLQIDTTTPDAPTTNIAAGTYNATQSVALSANDNSGGGGIDHIYYTTDGSAPTSSSTEYSGAISVSASMTIKAIAYDKAGNASGVMTKAYVIDTVAPNTPEASPVGGHYNSAQSVTLSASDNGGGSGIDHIYYTTDGSTPSRESTEYSGAISVSSDKTIKAISYDNAGSGSGIMTEVYVINENNPDAPENLGGSGYVDGSWGGDSTPNLTFTLSDDDTGNTVKYKIQIDTDSDFSSPVVDYTSPLAAQGATNFTVGQAAGLGSYTTGNSSQTLPTGSYYWRVKAIDNGASESAYSTANSGSVAFKIDATNPTAPGKPTATSPISNHRPTVSWSASSDSDSGLADPAYELQWSTDSGFGDSSSTTTNSTTATPNADLADGTWYFRVIASDATDNTTTSLVSSSVLIDTTDPNTPAASPAGGNYSSTQSVTLSASDNGGGSGIDHIYYTTDGSTPTSSSTEYATAISVGSDQTIKAISYDNAGNSSTVMSEEYVVDTTDPVITGTPSTTKPTTDNTPTWTWNAASDAGGSNLANPTYTVAWSTQSDFSSVSTATTNATSYTNATLADGTWYLRVRANDGAGNSSEWITGNTLIDTTAPTIPALSTTETLPTSVTTIHFKWTAATDAGVGTLANPAYLVQWCDNSGFTDCDSNTATTNTSSYTKALTEGTWYARIKATDSLGNASNWSSSLTVLIDRSVPTTPTANLASGSYGASQSVTLASSDSGGSSLDNIYYTTDGSTPTSSSTRYTGAITVNSNKTIKAIAYDGAGNHGGVMSKTYIIDSVGPNTPIASKSGGKYNTTLSIKLETKDNSGGSGVSTIYYTTDGSTPTNASTRYTGAITVSSSQTIKAIAYDNVGNTGTIMSEAYLIDRLAPATPSGNLESGSYPVVQALTLEASDTGGSGLEAIYYTVDGSTPTNASTRYTGAFVVITSSIIKAIAYDNAGNTSGVMVKTYSIGGTEQLLSPDNNTPVASRDDPILLSLPAGAKLTCQSMAPESELRGADSEYVYPNGLANFCFTTKEKRTTVTLVFVTYLGPDEVTVRKYNPNTKKYTNIPEAVVTQITQEGQPALRVSYVIVDNGPLDTDPRVGSIADPVGIATKDKPVTPISKILVRYKEFLSPWFWIAVSLVTLLLIVIVLKKKGRKDKAMEA